MENIQANSDLINTNKLLSNKETLHRLLDEGLSCVKSGKNRSATEVFSDIEKKFEFDKI